MEDKILGQLLELTKAFNERGIKPVICGGLGIYLTFHQRQKELPLRTTNDIDLMFTRSQVREPVRRNAIAEIITGQLNYIVREGGKYFQFEKGEQQYLDILTQPVEGVEIEGFRAKLVKSRLHGYVTPEACFVEEDLKTIKLSDIFPNGKKAADREISVPSLTNQLILKLFAFEDKHEGPRKDDVLVQAHAFDIYVIATLANANDYREGQQFLTRHSDSRVIEKAKKIVLDRFSSVDGAGWQHVLGAFGFYPNLNIEQKREKLGQAARRLAKWFSVSSRT